MLSLFIRCRNVTRITCCNATTILTKAQYRDESGGEILVSGGAGYVGSHVIVELLKNKFKVVSFDNLANCHPGVEGGIPAALKGALNIAEGSLLSYTLDAQEKCTLESMFKQHKFQCVYHLAALKSVGLSVKNPLLYYSSNVGGSINLLKVMNDHNVKQLVFSSSSCVYGNPQFVPITEGHPVGACKNPYGRTKFMTEKILEDLCNSDPEWKVISLRYSNAAGAHESGLIGEEPLGIPQNLIPYVAQVAAGKREKISVFGSDYPTTDGTGIRDYIHIMDLALGHIKAQDKFADPAFSGYKAYNLSTGKGHSVLEVIKAFSEVVGKELKHELVGRRPGDVAICYADTSLAEKELGFVATRDLKTICKDAWNWHKKNPNGYGTQT